MVIDVSTAFCSKCGSFHASHYDEVDNQVMYVIDCPLGPRRSLASSDARLFKRLRASNHWRSGEAPSRVAAESRPRLYLIELTSACDLHCAICYADARFEGRTYRPLAEVRQIVQRIRMDGGRHISLTGGEPTMHRDLPEIIRTVCSECGRSPVLVTNGLRLSQNSGYDYARELKAAGLTRVQLHFDAVDEDVQRQLQEGATVQEKMQAADNVCRAGLRLGLIATVSLRNLNQVDKIVAYAIGRVPQLRSLVFQPMIPVGRYPADLRPMTRDEVIRSLLDGATDDAGTDAAAASYALHAESFHAAPPGRHSNWSVHPDCSAHAVMCVWGKRAVALEHVKRTRTAARRRGAFRLSVLNFMHGETRDERRLRHCIVYAPLQAPTPTRFVSVCQRLCDKQTRPLENTAG